MRKRFLSSFVKINCLLIIFAVSALSQTAPVASKPTPPPGKIILPAGYVYERRQGIDSHVGSIVRSDGFTITHDIGRMAGVYADEYFPEHFELMRKRTHLNPASIEADITRLQGMVEWRQRQKMNGDDLMLVRLKDSRLIASFVNSNANFIAKVDSDEKIADFLLIVLTYQPSLDKRD